MNGEVQVAAEDPLTGGSPSIHGTTRSKSVAGEDTTMSRFGHYSIFVWLLFYRKEINLFASISLANRQRCHVTLNAPVPIRTLKLSSVEPC